MSSFSYLEENTRIFFSYGRKKAACGEGYLDLENLDQRRNHSHAAGLSPALTENPSAQNSFGFLKNRGRERERKKKHRRTISK